MFGSFFGAVGSAIGSAFGGGILSTIGRFAGQWLGKHFDQEDDEEEFREVSERTRIRNLKSSFGMSTAKYGAPIPLVFGTARVDGKIIWALEPKETRDVSHIRETYFQNSGNLKARYSTIECAYSISIAFAICEGEISSISRVWADGELISLQDYKFSLYHGSESQMPDPLISASNTHTPAFRGLSYVVFEDLPLADFSGNIPNLSFEVTRRQNLPKEEDQEKRHKIVEEMVQSIIGTVNKGFAK